MSEDPRITEMAAAVDALAAAWADLDLISERRKTAWKALKVSPTDDRFDLWRELVDQQNAAETRVDIARKKMLALRENAALTR